MQGYLQQEAIELLPWPSHVTGYECDITFMGLPLTKSECTYPKVSKYAGIEDCFGAEWHQYLQHRLRRLIHGMRRRVQEPYIMRSGYTHYSLYYE